MSKVYMKDIRAAAEQSVVDVSAKEVSGALYYSTFREMPVTLLDTRYRALPEDIWTQIFSYFDDESGEHASEHYDNDDFGQALSAFTRTKLDVNGVGMLVDTENKQAHPVILLYDPQIASDTRTESKALKVAVVEKQPDGYGISDPFTSEHYRPMEGFVLFS